MDERRDLVDREELRRRLSGERDSCISNGPYARTLTWALTELDAMPSVECPRGWTRDEVLAEFDAAEQRGDEAVCEFRDPIDGRWWKLTRHTVGTWHPEVRRYDVRVVVVERAPEWVPLTQLVGRTPYGQDDVVTNYGGNADGPWARAYMSKLVSLTVNDDGLVAVRPKAAK